MLNSKNNVRFGIVLIVGLSLLGIILRLYFYILNRSLWLDEASLALNIVNRSFPDLFKPLDYYQGAPLGFLFAQKTIGSLLGYKDYVLRFIPLIAGIASIFLMFIVSKKIGRQISPYICLGLFVLSPRLIYYSSELKQYSTDVLATLLLLILVPDCLDDEVKPRTLVTLGITGCLCLWFSHPSLFIYLGILMTLGLTFLIKKDKTRIFWVIGIAVVSGINFLLVYLINLRFLISNDILLGYWNGSFAPLPPWSNLNWYYKTAINMLNDPAYLPISVITGLLFLVGIISFGIRRWQILSVVLTPIILTLAASALRKYAFSGRLLLFMLPLVFLLLSDGIEQIRILILKVNRPLAEIFTFLPVIFLLYQPIIETYRNVQSPPSQENIKPVMAYIQNKWINSDYIYVYYAASTAFMFYAPQYGITEKEYIIGVADRNEPMRYIEDIESINGKCRVWFVFSHNCSWCKVNEEEYILEYLNKTGQKIDEFKSEGASVYLFNMGNTPLEIYNLNLSNLSYKQFIKDRYLYNRN